MTPFHSPFTHGFVRLAACASPVTPADPAANARALAALAHEAEARGAAVVVFPELSITGYALDDLHLQSALLAATQAALADLAASLAGTYVLAFVGAPLAWRGAVYNCAVALQGGRVLGVTPKSMLPNYREFYEKRWFASGAGLSGQTIHAGGQEAPFGTDIVYVANGAPDFVVHAEICEDMWVPIPPSAHAALAGATVLVNLSASNITIGKAAERKRLVQAHAARTISAYVFAAAGPGESTTDLAWDGQAFIVERDEVLAEGARFAAAPGLVVADVDVERLALERMRTGSFRDCAAAQGARALRRIAFDYAPPAGVQALERRVARFPFIPADPAQRDADCFEAYEIQVQGLQKRLQASGAKAAIVGVSGGLDSAHALIVAAKTADRLGWPRSTVKAYTLPGFATSEATKATAWSLMRALTVDAAEIDIRPAARQMLADLAHPAGRGEAVYDVTFENVQAGLRTDYLFRLANHLGGLVVGTGDLSELALGWCTYGVGDQMSHYGVNAGVPKTLIQELIGWCVRTGQYDPETDRALEAILATEISPELVPAGADGAIQSTEAKIGPYALHDFFLHYAVRFGLRPSKIAFLALSAWADETRGDWPEGACKRAFTLAEIRRWLEVFVTRFYGTSQFKRSALPNGPKVSAGGALSPRGDWRAPSDAGAQAWLAELRANVPKGEEA